MKVIGECELLEATWLHLPPAIDEDRADRCRSAGLVVHAANVNDVETWPRWGASASISRRRTTARRCWPN